MALSLTLKDIGYECFQDINLDSNFSEASIIAFLRSRIGELNNKLNTSFSLVESTLEFTPQISEEHKAILKALFFVYFASFKKRKSLGAADVSVTSYTDALGTSIRQVSKGELSKQWRDAERDAENTLQNMIAEYKINNISPLQVAGSDTYSDSQTTLLPSGCN